MRSLPVRSLAIVVPLVVGLGGGCAAGDARDDDVRIGLAPPSVAPAALNPPNPPTTNPCLVIPPSVLNPPGPGDVDLYFGCAGVASYGQADLDYQIKGLAIQADDKIIAVGSVFSQASNNNDVWVARYDANGKLDTSFGTNGVYTKNFTAPFGGGESAETAVVQPDGHIVVGGGFRHENGVDKGGFLIRLDASGVPDPGFGVGGAVVLSGMTWVRGVALQANDQLAVAGEKCTGSSATTCVATIGRFHGVTGAPDLVFAPGTAGIASTTFGGPAAKGYGLAVKSGDQVLLAGERVQSSASTDIGLMKLTGNAVDATFGANGVRTFDSKPTEGAFGVASLSLGGWVLAEGGASIDTFVVRRIAWNGAAIGSFGIGGRATAAFAGAGATSYAIVTGANGVSTAAGVATTAGGRYRMGVARFTDNGALDTTFSGDGQVMISAKSDEAWANAVARQSSGRLIVAGWSRNDGAKKRAAMARVLY